MIELEKIYLKDIMPSNLLNDNNVKEAASAIDKELQVTAEEIKYCLLLSRLSELNNETVDALAWQFHVDFYDDSLPIDIKRNLVRKSIDWHRRKGTPYAVQEVVSAILKGAQIQENWEYGGEAYHFKVSLITGPMANSDTITRLVKAINQTKNTRSWLDGVEFTRCADLNIVLRATVMLHKEINVGIKEFQVPDMTSVLNMRCANFIYKEVIVDG